MNAERSSADARVGLIGVGLVGTALSERLLAAGYEVAGYDISEAQLGSLRRLGGVAAGSALEASAGARRIILSLPSSDISASVLAEIAPRLPAGTIVIDTTTGEPDEMAAFGAALAAREVSYLDATVGGSSKLVREGAAILICGGERETFDACADLFAVCCRKAFHVGPWGAGARMKLVMNLVLGLNRAVLAEGLSFAESSGIDPAAALEILEAGPAYSRAMDAKGRKMIAQDFTVEARLSQHLKDVRLILASGAKCGAFLPLTAVHRKLLEDAEARGFGASDNSAVVKAYDKDPSR